MSLRKRFFAWLLEKGEKYNLQLYAAYKEDLFRDISGTVVEVGPGTGINFYYLQAGTNWFGVEPNTAFHSGLLALAKAKGIHAHLLDGDAEHIPLRDATADFIICSLVLCSVRDPQKAVFEMKRVLKSGGQLRFIEHVAARSGTALRNAQNLLNPVNRFFADGCHCNRETWHLLENAGFTKLDISHFRVDAALKLHTPHIMGVAQK